MVNSLVFVLLLLLVVICPLPAGSNHEWSWSLCSVLAGLLALIWGAARFFDPSRINHRLNPAIAVAFLLACAWAIVQQAEWSPAAWHHPIWGLASESLGESLAGSVSLSPDNTWTALMRLLGYALVFFLAWQLGRDRQRARVAFACLALAGLAYAVFGLAVYWGGYHFDWLYGDQVMPHAVRSTFINRNHFVTWQGLTMLCMIAWFYHRMARPSVKPYQVPQDREARAEEFILQAWKPMTALLLLVTALVLTHSRGGFLSAMAGTVVLLYLLDRRAASRSRLSRLSVIAALAVAGIAFFLTSEILLDRINRTVVTNENRLVVFDSIGGAIGDNPVLGFGYGTFADGFRLYDRIEDSIHFDRAHNTWLENAFELGLPAALALYAALVGLALTCLKGVWRRHRDWVFPATGVAASVLVGLHALVDFSLQIPAVAILYACIMGIACAQSFSSVGR